MVGKIEKKVTIFFPILLGVCFVLTRDRFLFYLYEFINLIQVFACYNDYTRKKIFITSCLFFNTYFLGIALIALYERKFNEIFYYCAMFVIAEMLSSIMVLVTITLELFFEKLRVLFQRVNH